ncbi:MAG: alpha-xylosidase [Chloroflexi bacterium]|nr:alpha-xylosidase [Chloroflexota bacterium]
MSLPFDLDAFVNNYDLPLHLIQAAELVEQHGFGLTLRCTTTQFQRRYRDRYGTLTEIAEPSGAGVPMLVGINFHTPEIVRVQVYAGADDWPPRNRTPMIAADLEQHTRSARVEHDEHSITLRTDTLRVTVDFDPWRLTISSRGGDLLFDTLPASVFQHPPVGASSIGGGSITDAWPWFFRHLFPFGCAHDPETDRTQTFFTARMRYDEHLYGFGEQFSAIDKRGSKIALWQANAAGNTWPTSYKNIPFFMSSRGYGLFINSAYPITYHLGDQSHTHYSVHLQDNHLDMFFIYGPAYKDILPRYTSLTGQPGLPPLWSFGLWMSRMSYNEQTQVETVAADLRDHQIPCDVIHIDTDWFADPWVNDLTFSPERFPDPQGMIARLREQGFRLTLWQIPYIAQTSAFYQEGVANGYFAKQPDGSPWLVDGFFGSTAVIDYSNPDAVAWIQSKFEPLFAMGVAAIKTDFGEGAPHDAEYATVDGLAMHNLYPLLYNQAIYEKTVEQTGEGIVWGRSAYAGSQRYPVHWGGDPAVLWGDLGNLWHGGLSLGLCGFPFWSVDIGGFGGTPSPELYTRWAQAGLFVSHPRAHGPIAREPWAFGARALDIFRKYAGLRYRLIPYLWSTANHCIKTSLPVLRPLLLDWQDDPTTATIDDQWLFGEWIMIAPILDESDHRQVYLPAGRWFDIWTGQALDGPRWLDVTAPLEVLPMYIRGGAILPMAPDMDYIGQRAWDPLTLDIYPDAESAFVLCDGDERILFMCRSNHETTIRIGEGVRAYEVLVHGLSRPESVTLDETVLVETDEAALVAQALGWCWLEEQVALIKLHGTDAVRTLRIR